MHPKIKNRPAGAATSPSPVKPQLLHDVTNPSASANAASRRRMHAVQAASGAANHARHHVSPQSQS
jgi:hypothetical protein